MPYSYLKAGSYALALQTAPDPPTGLTATANGQTQIDLTWVAPTTGTPPQAYRLERSTDGTNYSPVTAPDLSSAVLAYSDIGLTPNTQYIYRIRSVGNQVAGSASSTVSATTAGASAPIAGLSLTPTSGVAPLQVTPVDTSTGAVTSILIDYGDGTQSATDLQPHTYASYGTYFAVLTATGPGGSDASDPVAVTVTEVTVPNTPTDLQTVTVSHTQISLTWTDANAGTTTTEVVRSPYGTDSFLTVATLTAGVTSFVDSSLTPSTAYTYKVRAVSNAAAYSSYSLESSATTNPEPTPPFAPGTPSNFVAKNGDGGVEVFLAWDLADDTDTSIEIQRKTGTGSYGTLKILPGGDGCWMDLSTAYSTKYTYRVRAANDAGNSAWSAEQTLTTQTFSSSLPRVTNLAATPASPTTLNMTWTDVAGSNNNPLYVIELSDNGDRGFREYRMLPANRSSTTLFGLTPGTDYQVRLRQVTAGNLQSDFSNVVSFTTPALPAGTPLAPTRVLAEPAGTTSIVLTWVDTNAGAAQYIVERASAPNGTSWVNVATTSAGATGATATGLTAAGYYKFRVRGLIGSTEGENHYSADNSDVYCQTCASVGGRTLNIGPGQTYANIDQCDAANAPYGPGDRIRFHYKATPYREKITIYDVGTRDNPIVFEGVPDPDTGALPVFSGEDATASLYAETNNTGIGSGSAFIIVTRKSGRLAGYNARHILIQNFEFTNLYTGFFYTRESLGTPSAWGGGAASVYLLRCNQVTIQYCHIHDCGNGIFGKLTDAEFNQNKEVVIRGCYVHDCSDTDITKPYSHGIYMEAAGLFDGPACLYEFNRIGPNRPGGPGAGIKDRSAGSVARWNWIDDTGTPIQFADSQDSLPVNLIHPNYHKAWLYGNVVTQKSNNPFPIFWMGEDQYVRPFGRRAVFYAYHNTFLKLGSGGSLFNTSSSGNCVDARNNLFAVLGATPGANPSSYTLLRTSRIGSDGHYGYFGKNWTTAGYGLTGDTGGAAVVTAQGLGNMITGTDPDLTSPYSFDIQPDTGSPLIGTAGRLAGSVEDYPVTLQANPIVDGGNFFTGQSRGGGDPDIGAVQSGTAWNTPAAPAVSASFTAGVTAVYTTVPVSFTNKSTYGPDTFLYNFGDSGTSTSENPSHIYTVAGTYTVSLTATRSSDGSTSTFTRTNYIVVTDIPTAQDRADDFNRSDTTTGLGSPSDGKSPAWAGNLSSVAVRSNEAVGLIAQSATQILYLESYGSDVVQTATPKVVWTDARMAVRVVDNNNYIGLQFGTGFSTARIIQVQGGTLTVLATCSTNLVANDVITLGAIGTTVKAFKNSVGIGTATGVTFNQAATKHGLGFRDAIDRNRWDSYSAVVEDPQFPPDIYPPEFQSATCTADTLSVTFTDAVVNHTGLTLTASGGAVTLTYSSGEGTQTLVFGTSRTVAPNEVLSLSYTPGDIEDQSANALASFSGAIATNISDADPLPNDYAEDFSAQPNGLMASNWLDYTKNFLRITSGAVNCGAAQNVMVGTGVDCGSVNADVTVTLVKTWTQPNGPCVRVSAQKGYIGLECLNIGSSRIVQVAGGVVTALATSSGVTFTGGDTARLVVVGNEVRAYKNGSTTPICTATGVTYNNTVTRHGLGASTTETRNGISQIQINATNPTFPG